MVAWIHVSVSRRMVAILVAGVVGLCAMPGETFEKDHPAAKGRIDADDSVENKENHRIREGATLESELGEFLEEGKRIRFHLSDGKTSFLAIENLALDRISRVLDETTSARTWSVSGIVTEYRGGNYLIVTRAALKARAKPVTKTTPRD